MWSGAERSEGSAIFNSEVLSVGLMRTFVDLRRIAMLRIMMIRWGSEQ